MTVQRSSGFLSEGVPDLRPDAQHQASSNGVSQPLKAKEQSQQRPDGPLSSVNDEEASLPPPLSPPPTAQIPRNLVDEVFQSDEYKAAQKGRPTHEPQLDASRGGDTRYLEPQPNSVNPRRTQFPEDAGIKDSPEKGVVNPIIKVTRADTRSSGDLKSATAPDGTESVVSGTTQKINDNGDSLQLESTRYEKTDVISEDQAEQMIQSLSRVGGALEANDRGTQDSDSLSLDIPDTDLCRRLREAMVHPIDEKFLPVGDLDKLLTEEQVKLALCSAFPPGSLVSDQERQQQIKWMTTYICSRQVLQDTDPLHSSQKYTTARRIFAILVLIEEVPMIEDFIKEGLTDKDLPLERRRTKGDRSSFYRKGSKEDGRPLKFFDKCRRIVADNFFEWQWKLFSPFFAKPDVSTNHKVSYYALDDHIILPFTKTNERTEAGTPGGFGVVYQVTIHPDHHNFVTPNAKALGGETITFALKRLSTTKYEDFRDEVHALERFSNTSNPHLIQLLATYHHKGHYYLLFPWANGNLRDYWKRFPNPSLTHSRGRWVAGQCLGLAQALSKIHHWQDSHNDSSDEGKLKVISSRERQPHGRHGDIKPENILWFQQDSDNETTGVLKISDFGLTRFNSPHSASNQPRRGFQVSPTYRAPEVELEGAKMSRKYDIWTLGCLYVEFVIWLMLGSCAVVHLFPHDRNIIDPDEDTDIEWSEDTFFSLFRDLSGKRIACVRNSVNEWILFLYRQPHCSKLVRDFLDLIKTEMLQPDPNTRSEIGTVVSKLKIIVQKAEDPGYVHRGCLGTDGGANQAITCEGLGRLAQSLDAASSAKTFKYCDGKDARCPNTPPTIHNPRTKSRSSSMASSVGSGRRPSTRSIPDGATPNHYVDQMVSERNPAGVGAKRRGSSSIDDSKSIDSMIQQLRPSLGRSSGSGVPPLLRSPGSQTPPSPHDSRTTYFTEARKSSPRGDRLHHTMKPVLDSGDIHRSPTMPNGATATTPRRDNEGLKEKTVPREFEMVENERPQQKSVVAVGEAQDEDVSSASKAAGHQMEARANEERQEPSDEGRNRIEDGHSSVTHAPTKEDIPEKSKTSRPKVNTTGKDGRHGENGHGTTSESKKIKTGCWQSLMSWFRR